MKVLTAEMVTKSLDWCKDLGDVYVKYDGKRLYYTHPETASFDVAFPKSVDQLPDFVRGLAALCSEEKHFDGAKIWFTDAGIWDEFVEGIGYQILESINTAAGQPMSFWEARGYHFRADQLHKALGVLIQPMVFGWDAYYLPLWSWGGCSEYFLHVSHDHYVSVTTRSKDFHDRAIKTLAEQDLDFVLDRNGRISRYLTKDEFLAISKRGPDIASNP
jgi:hypothetical protein